MWLLWPQADYPRVWRQVAAIVGFTAAGMCGAWAVVSFQHMRAHRDALEALCLVGLLLMAASFMASPLVVWAAWMEGARAQYIAWAVRLVALLVLLPYTVVYLWRRKPRR